MPPPAMMMSYVVRGNFAAESEGAAEVISINVESNKQRESFDTFKVRRLLLLIDLEFVYDTLTLQKFL